jgi:hypothetical protein
MATGYAYRPLPQDGSHHIRVLRFDTSEDALRLDNLSCSMINDFDPREACYYAISYTWGDATRRSTIWIDGVPVSVPENTYNALRQVRCYSPNQDATTAATDCIYLWIDAVCINQEDAEEKGYQVSRMNLVYSQATAVLIWLGSGSGYGTETLDTIQLVFNHMNGFFEGTGIDINNPGVLGRIMSSRAPSQMGKIFGVLPQDEPNPDLPGATAQLLLTTDQWHLLKDLYSCTWFKRLWVIQEISLNPRRVCFYGSASISADAVLLGAVWLMWGQCHTFMQMPAGLAHAAQLPTFTHLKAKNDVSYFFTEPHAGCEDPRDKVFALLGLINSDLRRELHAHAPIEADYDKTTADVYRDFARALLKQSRELPCISSRRRLQACNAHISMEFPSWVPRLDLDAQDTLIGSLGYVEPYGELEIGERFRDPNVLSLRGIEVDEVSYLGAVFPWTVTYDMAALRNWLNSEANALFTARSKAYHAVGNLNLLEEIYLTLACGRLRENVPNWTELRQSMQAFMNKSVQLDEQYLIEARRGLPGRALFLTRNGFIGMPPCNDICVMRTAGSKANFIYLGMGVNVRLGDQLCCLFGGRSLYVLRREGEFWRMRGDAYVHEFPRVRVLSAI